MEKTVSINLTVHEKSLPEIKDMIKSYGFVMIFESPTHTEYRYFALEVKESDYSFLKLKFGSDNIWPR